MPVESFGVGSGTIENLILKSFRDSSPPLSGAPGDVGSVSRMVIHPFLADFRPVKPWPAYLVGNSKLRVDYTACWLLDLLQKRSPGGKREGIVLACRSLGIGNLNAMAGAHPESLPPLGFDQPMNCEGSSTMKGRDDRPGHPFNSSADGRFLGAPPCKPALDSVGVSGASIVSHRAGLPPQVPPTTPGIWPARPYRDSPNVARPDRVRLESRARCDEVLLPTEACPRMILKVSSR